MEIWGIEFPTFSIEVFQSRLSKEIPSHSACLGADGPVYWSVGWSVGRLDGRSLDKSVVWSVSWSAVRFLGWLVFRKVERLLIGWLSIPMVNQYDY